MCGVFGFIKKNLNSSQFQIANELRLMRQMMIVGSLRGIDGTGMAVIDKNFSPCTLKIGDNPYSLIHDEAFGSAIAKPFEDDGRAFFGHNRYATKGEVSTENAHPFMIDHITLVHNGTINFGLDVPKGKVDSMALTQRLATDGIKVFSEIDGAWTCVWYDSIEKSINFLCNGERPLHIVENFNGIYWASEEKMLVWTLSSLNFNFMANVKIPLDTVISYKLDQQLSRTETKVPTRSKYNYQPHYYIGNDDKITKDGYKNKSPKTESKSYIPKKQQSEVIVKFFRKLYNSSKSKNLDSVLGDLFL